MSTATIPPLRVEERALLATDGRRELLVGLAVGVAGAAAAFGLMGVVDRSLAAGELESMGGIFLLGLVPVFLLVVGFHELGHLTAGRLVGFRFLLFLLGPLKVWRAGERVRWGLNRSLLLAGGAAASAPAPGEMHDLRRRYRWMIAGGPLASLLLGVAALGAASALGDAPVLLELAILCGGLSLCIGAATLIPNRAGGLTSDGARLLLLARGAAGAEQEAAFLGLGTALMLGHRPREWAPELVARIYAPGEGQTGANAALMAYMHAMDGGREDEAARHLQRALDLLPALPRAQRPSVTLEAAFFEAMVRGDAAAARRWLEALPPTALVGPHYRLRAEAAVLMAEGRPEPALAKAAEARAAFRRNPAPGAAALFDEELRAIERRAVPAPGDPSLTHTLSR